MAMFLNPGGGTINELALAEIKEGSTYQRRIKAARWAAAGESWLAVHEWASIANDAAWRYERAGFNEDRRKFTAAEILQCAVELEAYYRQHLTEMEG